MKYKVVIGTVAGFLSGAYLMYYMTRSELAIAAYNAEVQQWSRDMKTIIEARKMGE